MSPLPQGEIQDDSDQLSGVCDHFLGWPTRNKGLRYELKRLLSIFDHVPISVATDRSQSGRSLVSTQVSKRPDLIVVDFPHASVLIPDFLSVPSVLFTHNIETEIFRRHALVNRGLVRNILWRDQARKMERFERQTLRRFDAVVAVSERDARHFKMEYGVPRVDVIPTGVDLDYFTHRVPRLETQGSPTIVFTGSMDWLANVDGISFFMDDVWPMIQANCPSARMVVVGRNPPSKLVRAARDRGLPWHFTGLVDDVRPFVHESDIFIIPLRVGGGTRIKAYEAMAMGCPVVSTEIGMEGLPVLAGRDFLQSDTPEEFAKSVIHLIDSPARRCELARNARTFVEENFSTVRVARVFERICINTLARVRRTVAIADAEAKMEPRT